MNEPENENNLSPGSEENRFVFNFTNRFFDCDIIVNNDLFLSLNKFHNFQICF